MKLKELKQLKDRFETAFSKAIKQLEKDGLTVDPGKVELVRNKILRQMNVNPQEYSQVEIYTELEKEIRELKISLHTKKPEAIEYSRIVNAPKPFSQDSIKALKISQTDHKDEDHPKIMEMVLSAFNDSNATVIREERIIKEFNNSLGLLEIPEYHRDLKEIGSDDHHKKEHDLESHIDSKLKKQLMKMVSGEYVDELHKHFIDKEEMPRIIDIAGITKNDADSWYLRLDGTTTPEADIDWGGFAITGLKDPVNPQDAVTLAYLDDGFVPYTGANANVDLGAFDLDTTGEITATTFLGDLNGTINTLTTGATQSPLDNSTKIATTAYVDAAVLSEDLWDRTGTTIVPHTAGDDLDMGTGDIDTSGYICGGYTRINGDGIDFKVGANKVMKIQNFALDYGFEFWGNDGMSPHLFMSLDHTTGMDLQAHDFDTTGDLTANNITATGWSQSSSDLSSMECTGFDEANPTLRGDISFANGTPGVFTIDVQGGESYFNVWINNKEYRKTSAETLDISDTEGLHYIYYDSATQALEEAVNPSDQEIATVIRTHPIVAIIYWNTTDNEYVWFSDERHLNQMDGSTHSNLHFSFGTRYRSGGALGDFDLDETTASSGAQFSYGLGVIQDEDLSSVEQNIASTVGYPIMYLENGNWRTKTQAGFPIMTDVTAGIDTTGRTVYNDVSIGGSESLVVVGDKDFVLCHILQTNGAEAGEKVWAVMGQETYEKKKDARLGAVTEVNNLILTGLPGPEFMFLGTVIFECRNGYANAVKSTVRETDLGDNYVDWRSGTGLSPTSPAGSHSSLSGLTNDDHAQYLLADGSRALTADWDAGAFDITAVEFKGALIGQANTVATITGLAPDTATTQAAQGNITSLGTLTGLTMGGNIAMGDNSITGIDTLTFTDTSGTIAGIANGNLVDKSASETIAGEWTFGVFPITPSAEPDADYEVANKKYVDDNSGVGYWKRTGTLLEPITAGDAVLTTGTITAGTGITAIMGGATKGWEFASAGFNINLADDTAGIGGYFTNSTRTINMLPAGEGINGSTTIDDFTFSLLNSTEAATFGDGTRTVKLATGSYGAELTGGMLLTGDLGITGTRVTKGWFTDLEVTNAIAGSITGNAGTVTNGVYTTDFPLNQDTTGNAATVSTITGLAPDTATTQATQPNITSAVLLPWTGLKPGVDGEIPTFDASGDPAFVAVGTATHVLTSNGVGVAPTFQAAAGGAPGGADTNIQFNDSGAFGGSANLVWDGTNIGLNGDINQIADNDSIAIFGGSAYNHGAYFHITGDDYGASPGKSSAEFVIGEIEGQSRFKLISFDGSSTWTERLVLDGDNGEISMAGATAVIVPTPTEASHATTKIYADEKVDTGATLPASPVKGGLFLHAPTGRSILYEYDGSDWIAIQSLGATTIYVDGTDGTDSLEKGTGVDAAAFATIQYAIDLLPSTNGGNVIINIAAGTYTENLSMGGKGFSGDYTITLKGTLTSLATGTATGKVQGTGATQGTLTHAGQFGAYDNKLLHITTEDVYRIIDSDTSDTLTITGCFTNTTNKGYTVYDWGTIIDGSAASAVLLNDQKNIVLENLSIPSSSTTGIFNSNYSTLTIRNCEIETTVYNQFSSKSLIYSSVINPDSFAGVVSDQFCMSVIYNTKIYGAGTYGIYATTNGATIPINGCIIDTFTYGMNIITASSALQNIASLGYIRIRNCTVGVQASSGGQVSGITNTVYSGNSTDANAVTASFGYIA